MRWKVYNPPLLPYDECIFMSSGTACSPCKCVGSLQHSQAKLRLYEVIKQVCSSLCLNLLQLFLNGFILIWLQILRYQLIGIIRRVGGGGFFISPQWWGNTPGHFRSAPPSLFFPICSDNQSPDSQYEEAASTDVFLCVYLERFACTDVLAYLYVNQRVWVFFEDLGG